MNDYLTILVITAATGVGGLALGGSLAPPKPPPVSSAFSQGMTTERRGEP